MADQKEIFKIAVLEAINQFKLEKKIECDEIQENLVRVENPPKPEMGDLGCPMFPFAKSFHLAPNAIASGVVGILIKNAESSSQLKALGEFLVAGPYVNVKLDKASSAVGILKSIIEQGESYGSCDSNGTKHFAGRKIMVEFSSPNTNKPLHLGHLRNDALGESVSRILKKAGAEVFKVDLINNRGVHICKSMLAYKLFHQEKNETPESLGIKGDHFVGQCYVEFDKYSKEHPEALEQAEEMLIKWEQGDAEVRELWQKMNDWTLDGLKETYKRTGIELINFISKVILI